MFFGQLIGQMIRKTINIVTQYPTASISGVKKHATERSYSLGTPSRDIFSTLHPWNLKAYQ